MSGDLGSVLIGGLVTMVGGGSVAWWVHRLAGKAASLEQDRLQKAQQREHIVEVIDAGREWAQGFETLGVALASPMTVDDLLKSEHWSQVRMQVARYRRALTAAELVLVDDVLYEKAKSLGSHMAEQTTVMESLTVGKVHGIKAAREEVEAVMSFVENHRLLLDEFVAIARTRLAV